MSKLATNAVPALPNRLSKSPNAALSITPEPLSSPAKKSLLTITRVSVQGAVVGGSGVAVKITLPRMVVSQHLPSKTQRESNKKSTHKPQLKWKDHWLC